VHRTASYPRPPRAPGAAGSGREVGAALPATALGGPDKVINFSPTSVSLFKTIFSAVMRREKPSPEGPAGLGAQRVLLRRARGVQLSRCDTPGTWETPLVTAADRSAPARPPVISSGAGGEEKKKKKRKKAKREKKKIRKKKKERKRRKRKEEKRKCKKKEKGKQKKRKGERKEKEERKRRKRKKQKGKKKEKENKQKSEKKKKKKRRKKKK